MKVSVTQKRPMRSMFITRLLIQRCTKDSSPMIPRMQIYPCYIPKTSHLSKPVFSLNPHLRNSASAQLCMTARQLQVELRNLAQQWDRLSQSPLDDNKTKTVEEESEDQEEMDIASKTCVFCKECPLCCYKILPRFNILTHAYPLLELVYKYLLTLSITQLACEWSFSTL